MEISVLLVVMLYRTRSQSQVHCLVIQADSGILYYKVYIITTKFTAYTYYQYHMQDFTLLSPAGGHNTQQQKLNILSLLHAHDSCDSTQLYICLEIVPLMIFTHPHDIKQRPWFTLPLLRLHHCPSPAVLQVVSPWQLSCPQPTTLLPLIKQWSQHSMVSE